MKINTDNVIPILFFKKVIMNEKQNKTKNNKKKPTGENYPQMFISSLVTLLFFFVKHGFFQS